LPEIIKNRPKKQNAKKTKKLGRGLSSLLTIDSQSFQTEQDTEKDNKNNKIESSKKMTSQNNVDKNDQVTSQKTQKMTKQLDTQSSARPKATELKVEDVKSAPKEVKAEEPKAAVQEKVSDNKRVWDVSVDKVFPNKRQPRKDFEPHPLEELALSIVEQGILQPITVRKVDGEGYEIIAGERRWRAAQKAGLHQVPVIIKDVDDQKVMELALIENLQRENLNPVEEAIAYQQLVDDYGLTQVEVANKVGKDRATVANALRILALPKQVKRALRSREISTGHAKVLLSLGEEPTQISMLKKTIAEKLSVRALEKEIRRAKSGSGSSSTVEKENIQLESLTGELQNVLGTKVKIKYKKGKGRFEIAFYSEEQFQSLLNRFKRESL